MSRGLIALWGSGRARWLMVLVVGVVVVGGVSVWMALRDEGGSFRVSSAEVVIIDQLQSSFPNASFRMTVTEMMGGQGWDVDYYGHKEVTVELFRNLLRNDYRLIVLRVHAATGYAVGQSSRLALFTGEPYSKNKYIWEQISNQVERVRVNPESDSYFGIYESFVSDVMEGVCVNATIVMMGCDGLTHTEMAEAFISRGAGVYVGWDGMVMADYVDRATVAFLRGVVEEDMSAEAAVGHVRGTVGADPVFGSEMAAYLTT